MLLYIVFILLVGKTPTKTMKLVRKRKQKCKWETKITVFCNLLFKKMFFMKIVQDFTIISRTVLKSFFLILIVG